nr:uncharacterized protein LOC131764200 [Kogia breviceps]
MEALGRARPDLTQTQSEITPCSQPPTLWARRFGDCAQSHPATPASSPAPTRSLLALAGFSRRLVPVLGRARRLHRLLALTCFWHAGQTRPAPPRLGRRTHAQQLDRASFHERFGATIYKAQVPLGRRTVDPDGELSESWEVWRLRRRRSRSASEDSRGPLSPRSLPPPADASAFASRAGLGLHGNENKPRVKQKQYKSPNQNSYNQIQGKQSTSVHAVKEAPKMAAASVHVPRVSHSCLLPLRRLSNSSSLRVPTGPDTICTSESPGHANCLEIEDHSGFLGYRRRDDLFRWD